MITKTKEIVIKCIAEGVFYGEPKDFKPWYVYEQFTNYDWKNNALEK